MANNIHKPRTFYALLISLMTLMAFGLIGTIMLSDSSKAEARNQLLALLGAGTAGLLALLNVPQQSSLTEIQLRLDEIERRLDLLSKNHGMTIQGNEKVSPTTWNQSHAVAVRVQPVEAVKESIRDATPVSSVVFSSAGKTSHNYYVPTNQQVPLTKTNNRTVVSPGTPNGYKGEY